MMKEIRESRYNIWVERDNAFYVHNGISGALLHVPKRDYRAFRRLLAGEGGDDCPPELLSNLLQRRMLILDDEDEVAMLERRYHDSRSDASRFYLTIVTSLGCNFDCPYCFEAKHISIMDDEVQEAVIQVLDDQLPKVNQFKVRWFGGEPLVGKKPLLFLSAVFIEHCARAGVEYEADIVTNGYLLDEEMCKQLHDSRVTAAIVSLDGPAEIHDQMRPLSSGKGSFSKIVKNLHYAVEYFDISVRVNINAENFTHVESLLQILHNEGFAGRLKVYPGQLVGLDYGVASPSSTYRSRCLTRPEFARAELEFVTLAERYGLATQGLPDAVSTPCTAVRANELVVGSKGELYKCFESVGNSLEVIGDIRDYKNPNGRLQKWLKYDPFADIECRTCIALPTCMGGCAHHAMNQQLYENRCGTFRHINREQIMAFVERTEQTGQTTATVPVKIERLRKTPE